MRTDAGGDEAAAEMPLPQIVDPWRTPGAWDVLYQRLEAELGCGVREPTPKAGLQSAPRAARQGAGTCYDCYDPGVDYCGAGCVSIFNLSVSEALNKLCYDHDRCYGERDVGSGCLWNTTIADCCDAPFISKCGDRCPGGSSQ